MKRRNFLQGLVYSAVPLLILDRCSVLSSAEPLKRAEKNSLDSRLENIISSNKNLEGLYKTLENYISFYYKGDDNKKGYIDFMSAYSNELRKNIKLSGKEKVIESYVEVQRKCLVLALLSAFKEVNDRDIDNLSDDLVQNQKENAKETYIDYSHSAVKKGYISFSKEKTEFFKKIIEKNINNPQKDFRELFRNAFTKEEYMQELEKQQKARKDLYGGFADSLENQGGFIGFFIRIFGPGIIDKIRRKSDEYGLKEIDKIYSSDKD